MARLAHTVGAAGSAAKRRLSTMTTLAVDFLHTTRLCPRGVQHLVDKAVHKPAKPRPHWVCGWWSKRRQRAVQVEKAPPAPPHPSGMQYQNNSYQRLTHKAYRHFLLLFYFLDAARCLGPANLLKVLATKGFHLCPAAVGESVDKLWDNCPQAAPRLACSAVPIFLACLAL